MAKYYFHIIFDDHCKLDDIGTDYSNPYKAVQEAALMIITLALDATVYGKPVPRQIAVVTGEAERTLVAIKDTE